MQVAVHQIRRPHGIHDALKPLAVRVVARTVRWRPPRRRPREGVGDARRAVVTHHHVRVAARDDGCLLPAGDLLLRPPTDTLGAARLVEAHAAAAGQPAAAAPLPAVTTRQAADIRPDRDASARNGVAGHPGKLREVLMIPVSKPQLRVHQVQDRTDAIQVTLALDSRPDPEVPQTQDQPRPLAGRAAQGPARSHRAPHSPSPCQCPGRIEGATCQGLCAMPDITPRSTPHPVNRYGSFAA
jgi:hypothetical protein